MDHKSDSNFKKNQIVVFPCTLLCTKIALFEWRLWLDIFKSYSVLSLYKFHHQSPLILTALLHIELINVAYLTAFIRSSLRCTFLSKSRVASFHFFEWRQWHWIDTKLDNNVIIASLKSESTCKMRNRIPGLRHDLTSVLEALPGNFYIKRHSSHWSM